MSLGLVAVIIAGDSHQFATPLPVHFSIFGFVISVFLVIVSSLATKRFPEKLLDETLTGLYIRDKR